MTRVNIAIFVKGVETPRYVSITTDLNPVAKASDLIEEILCDAEIENEEIIGCLSQHTVSEDTEMHGKISTDYIIWDLESVSIFSRDMIDHVFLPERMHQVIEENYFKGVK